MAARTIAGQLSLPLFEPDPDERQRERSSAHPPKPKTHGAVVASRSQSQSLETPACTSGLLTTNEAATRLHVHPRTVQRLVERGQLSAVRLGAAVRFDPADLASLTDRLKHNAGAPPAAPANAVRAGRGAGVSFADRLRSHQHEHRAAQA
jgi:excisionase family DNA binding protein